MSRRGFTVIETLVFLAVTGLLMLGASAVYRTHARTHAEQNATVTTEGNLRIATLLVSDALRNTNYGIPTTALATWVPWVGGFSANPTVVDGASGAPDQLSAASCTDEPVTTLAADANLGASSITIASTAGIDTNRRRLLRIGDEEFLHVVSLGSTTATIDTQPAVSGNQGLTRRYLAGTPICRVDVVTFDVAVDPATGTRALRMNLNQGGGPVPAVEGIEDLQIVTVSAGLVSIELTARSGAAHPLTGAYLTRKLGTRVALKN